MGRFAMDTNDDDDRNMMKDTEDLDESDSGNTAVRRAMFSTVVDIVTVCPLHQQSPSIRRMRPTS